MTIFLMLCGLLAVLWLCRSTGDEGGEQGLDLVDVHTPPELLDDAVAVREPDRQLGVEVEHARGLHPEVGDAAVGDRVVLHLAPGHALLVDEDQPAVGEQERVADEQVGRVHLLAFREQAAVLLRRLLRVDPRRVARDAVEKAHARLPEDVVELDGTDETTLRAPPAAPRGARAAPARRRRRRPRSATAAVGGGGRSRSVPPRCGWTPRSAGCGPRAVRSRAGRCGRVPRPARRGG